MNDGLDVGLGVRRREERGRRWVRVDPLLTQVVLEDAGEACRAGEGGPEGDRLKGVGASGGKVTGVACVLHGPQDFDQMELGGILVAKLTTPAWTPLFTMAGGVVTDIGGPLSHGSIVSREYGIPAVLGTGEATKRIRSGQRITVNGSEVLPHKEFSFGLVLDAGFGILRYNGFVNDPSEVCDDGNLNTGDGCNAACLLEVGEPCAGDTDCASDLCNLAAIPPVCAPPLGCGNGLLEA